MNAGAIPRACMIFGEGQKTSSTMDCDCTGCSPGSGWIAAMVNLWGSHGDRNDAISLAIQKAKKIIDERGDALFIDS